MKKITPKFIIGLLFLLAGTLILMDKQEIIQFNYYHYFVTWKSFLLILGIYLLFSISEKIWGVLFFALGLILIFPSFSPIVIILIGVFLLMKPKNTEKVFNKHEYRNNTEIEDIAIFGGNQKIFPNKNFSGGKLISIFGGSEIDLRNATLNEGINYLNCLIIFGGSSILIPSEWNIQLEIIPIFGGFADKRMKSPNAKFNNNDKTLVIKGVAIFGGGEVKNY